MAETMTYDPGTDTVTTENNLTPEEQESLKVGEKMQAEQEQLLAGKYKDAKDLEKAYIELQKKLGAPEEKAEAEVGEEAEPKAEEKSDDPYTNAYLEDGKVNYDQVNETYGEQIGNVFKNANVDPWEISKAFEEGKGKIPPEMNQKLVDAGFPQDSINAYLAGKAAESGYTTEQQSGFSDNDIASIQNSVGGEDAYKNMVNWASTNLDKDAIDAFDSLINSGDVNAVKFAVTGLKAQYEAANGYEGTMVTGKAPKTNTDVFRSQPELVAAMSDPRYDRDPAYRQDVIDKLERSDNLKF